MILFLSNHRAIRSLICRNWWIIMQPETMMRAILILGTVVGLLVAGLSVPSRAQPGPMGGGRALKSGQHVWAPDLCRMALGPA
jgi:hypothetical protein